MLRLFVWSLSCHWTVSAWFWKEKMLKTTRAQMCADVIREDWVRLSGEKSGPLIFPVREWRVIGHIWPSVLWTVGTRTISTSGNWLMKHFRSSSARLPFSDCDRARHVRASVWPESAASRCVCKPVRGPEKTAECRNSPWPSLQPYRQHRPPDACSTLTHWQRTH